MEGKLWSRTKSKEICLPGMPIQAAGALESLLIVTRIRRKMERPRDGVRKPPRKEVYLFLKFQIRDTRAGVWSRSETEEGFESGRIEGESQEAGGCCRWQYKISLEGEKSRN